MSRKNEYNESIDPRLLKLLHVLQAIPRRDERSTARGQARYLAEMDALGLTNQNSPLQDFMRKLHFTVNPNQQPKGKDEPTMTTRIQKLAITAAVTAIAMMVILFGSGAMTAYASQAALPGDGLYPIKTGIEQTQITFSKNPAVQAALHLDFAQRRLNEMAALIKDGRFNNVSKTSAQFEYHIQQATALLQMIAAGNPAQASAIASQVSSRLTQYTQALNSMLTSVPENTRTSMTRAIQVSTSGSTTIVNESGEVEFTGTVEAMDPASWTVSGRVLAITLDTQIEGVINLNDLVEVKAFTAEDGTLTAREIQLDEAGNANANDNQNGNVNGNDNGNTNLNDNQNGNLNGNDNEDVNDNENDNENENHNGNTNEQHHEKTDFSGAVEMISPASWTIAGRTVAITPDTQIEGSIIVGSQVEVVAMVNADGTLTALKIKLSENDEDNFNGNTNENTNGNINSNTNSNENENHNGNENDNENDNDHEGNHNSNVNQNGNTNFNGNSNDNGGDD